MTTTPLHFTFADGSALDDEQRRRLLGGKGAALVAMTDLGLPVPPGFTVTTDACRRFLADGWFAELDAALDVGIGWIEDRLRCRLGDPAAPLLVSVRSGAPVSMPGMMDTVLNAGMTDAVADALGERTGDPRFGWDTARRFVQSYATVVGGAASELVAAASADCLGDDEGRDLEPVALAAATRRFRDRMADAGRPVPDDPRTQITEAVRAVFRSWNSDRAQVYRRVEGIADDLGTAATVQAMTFGNLGGRSGTGVAFTRDPSTGAPGLVGDFLVGAQGEDVVAGTHATRSLGEMRAMWPDLADELDRAAVALEHHLDDMADIEFTVEDGRLWLLQVRRGKRSPRAALRIAIDLAEDPSFALDRAGAVARVEDILVDPPTAPAPADDGIDAGDEVVAEGLAASPGCAVGVLCTDVDETIERAARGEAVVLVRRETSPADIAGMAEAVGLVTSLGGMVSHAAVVARSWGVPAVVGAGGIDVLRDGVRVGDRLLPTGETVTVDGDRGLVLRGARHGTRVELDEVRILRSWLAATRQQPTAPAPADTGIDAGDEVGTADLSDARRVVGLKGMGSADILVAVLGWTPEKAAAAIDVLVAAGDADEMAGGRVRLTKEAAGVVEEDYRAAAARLSTVIEPVLESFHAVNTAFKELISAWQMREVDGEQVANDHSDAGYDASVVARLETEIHAAIAPIVDTVAAAEPRFGRYRERLEAALAAVRDGEAEMMAHPLRDSYHTVWFELHEELIRLSGRNRADEAAAGRA